jgi:branched-chain amino acid transport system ATP-binding protein
MSANPSVSPAPSTRSGGGEAALELTDIRKRFGKTEIIRGVSLSIKHGERHALIGPNGAGKSTLFNLISGRFPPSSGTIRLLGTEITGRRPFEINRLGLSRSFQITNIFNRLSVFENLRCSVLWSLGYRYSFWRNLNKLRDAEERAEAVLQRIGLKRRRNIAAGLLTYAEQRALEIGITIAGGASVILLDEPTAGMSRGETANAVALIREITQGKTLVMVEHDMGVVFDLADTISVVVYGEIIASGPPARIRADPKVKEAYLGQHAEAA